LNNHSPPARTPAGIIVTEIQEPFHSFDAPVSPHVRQRRDSPPAVRLAPNLHELLNVRIQGGDMNDVLRLES
jgi:hypothetical protein